MKYFITSLLALCLSISANTAFSQVVNDECTGAILLDPTPGVVDCSHGTTGLATPSAYPEGCYSPVSNDVWYRFTANQANYTIQFTDVVNFYFPNYGPVAYKVEVFSGNCTELQGLTCRYLYSNSEVNLNNLTTGEDYFIRIYGSESSNINSIEFDLCLKEEPLVGNDECINAITIIPSADLNCTSPSTEINFIGATQSLAPCTGATNANDVWYKFVATSASHLITMSSSYGNVVEGELLTGSCNSLTSIQCLNSSIQSNPVLQGLTVGQTYYLRFSVDQYLPAPFTFCILTLPAPPLNDECASAIPLPINEDMSCTNQLFASTVGATNSSLVSCMPGAPHDIWYSFTATSTQMYIETPYLSGQDIGYNYSVGYSLFPGGCDQPEQACGVVYNAFSLTGLGVGTVYYLRLFTEEGSGHGFNICARAMPDLPSNSYCATAELVTINDPESCNTIIQGSTLGGGNPGLPYTCISGPSLWYQFTATTSACKFLFQNTQVLLNSPELLLGVFEGGCDVPVLISCGNVGNGSITYVNGLIPGNTYYFAVASPVFSGSTFNLCIQAVDGPSNDQCTSSIELPINNGLDCTNGIISGTTVGAGIDSGVTCFEQPTVWYAFTPTQSAHTISINNIQMAIPQMYSSIDYTYSVFQGNCGQLSLVNCVAWASSAEISLTDLVPGVPCYIAIGSPYANIALNFDLCLLTPPAPPINDACTGATVLTVNTSSTCEISTSGTLLNSTNSFLSQNNCCSGYSDVWYSFTATQQSHELVLNNLLYVPYNIPTTAVIAVYSGVCGQLVPVLDGVSINNGYSVLLSGLTPGASYYVYVAENNYYEGNDISFDICVKTPTAPVNDLCTDAIPLQINTDLICTQTTEGSFYASNSSSQNNCGLTASPDVWYSFEATGSNYRMELANYYESYLYGYGFELLKGDCGQLESVLCQPVITSTQHLSGLEIGATYYVRMFYQNQPGTFSLCMLLLPNPPVNDQCENAVVVEPSSSLTCTQTYPGILLGATVVDTTACQGYLPDVWYAFTATAPHHILQLQNVNSLFSTYYYGPYIEILTGECGDLNSVECVYNTTAPFRIATNIGEVYYVRVLAPEADEAFVFDFCVTTAPSQATNTTCFTAVEMIGSVSTECEITYPGNTAGGEYLTSGPCWSGYSNWYHFTAPNPINLLEVQNYIHGFGGTGLSVEIFEGTDCNNLDYLSCQNIISQPALPLMVPGHEYYIRILSDYNSGGTFDLCLKSFTPPTNDLCNNAAQLTVYPELQCAETTAGTTYAAGLNPTTYCTEGPSGDVWYQFTAVQSAHTITLQNVFDHELNWASACHLEVFTGSCDDLQQVACRPFRYSVATEAIGDLVPGQTYFIRILSTNAAIDFDICISTPVAPPANDACMSATEIPVSQGAVCDGVIQGTTANATFSWSGVYDGLNSNDVWYSFTASAPTHILQVSNIQAVTYYGYTYSGYLSGIIYPGDCSLQAAVYSFNFYGAGQELLTNLVPGQQYIVRIYTQSDPASFDLCVSTPAIAPNDACENAIVLAPNTDLTCAIVANGTTLGASSSQVGCEPAGSTDVWYQFVATSSQVRLSYTHDYGNTYYSFNTGFEVFSGNCGTLTSLNCYNSTADAVIQGELTVGETYYVRVFSPANQYINFSLCLITLPEPPANDLCANAIPLTVNPDLICVETVEGTTLGATQTQNGYCPYYVGHDIWYQFIAGNTGLVVDFNLLSSVFSTNSLVSIEILSGTCDNIQTVTCRNMYSSYSFLQNDLIAGDTYFIRIQSALNAADQFSLCLRSAPAAPVNLSCSTALPVEPNTGLDCTEFVSGETTGVPETSYSSCYNNSRSLWYEFTATSSYHIISLSNENFVFGNAALSIEVFAGENCESLSYILCNAYGTDVQLTNLVVGNKYYLRISDNEASAASFDLCIKTIAPPANDHCANATTLSVSPDLTCAATTAGTTAGADFTSDLNSCDPNVGQDVWYSFTATQSSHVVTLSNINNFDPQAYNYANSYMEVYAGSCDNLQSVRCFNNLYPYELHNKTIGELEPGTTYYIRVGGYYTLINFDICVTTPEPAPENDACAHATNLVVPAGPTCVETVFGTTQGATSSGSLANYPYIANDVWYSFTATQQNHTLHITDIGSGYGYISGVVYDGSCSNLNVVHNFNTYQPQDVPLTNLAVGATYYIRLFVESYLPPTSFHICISSPAIPANDECAGAINIPVNTGYACETVVTGTNAGATSSVSGCVSGPSTDVWYQFEATGSDMRITFDNLIYTSSYHGIEIMEGNCGTLSSVVCILGYPNFYNLTGLTVGQTYYVRVYAYANTMINFSLCLIELPPTPTNDLCENAITLPVNPDMQCAENVSGITASLTGSSSSYCYYGPDMWYQFTANNETHVITLNNVVQLFGSGNISIEVHNSDYCSNLTAPLLCGYPGSHLLSGLTPGANYLVRVIGSADAASSFDLCVRTFQPITNDECDNAIILTPSEGLDCSNSVEFAIIDATPSLETSYCYSGLNDVWFAFEATSFEHQIQFGGAGYAYYYIEIYRGICGNLEVVQCTQSYSSGVFYLNSLTPGASYYIRILQPSWYTPGQSLYNICINTTPVDVETPYTVSANGACSPGSQAPVQTYIFNNTDVYIPAGQLSATLAVTGNNTGDYGPITNQYPIYPYSSAILVFEQVDLSNTGTTTITSTISLLGDTNPANNVSSSTFDVLPLLIIYRDNDGDGYGNDAMFYESCNLHSGYTTTGGDCNDENVNVHPGATEICNGIDDDCDGSIDETTLALQLTAPVIPCGGSTALLTALATGGSGSYQYSIDSMAFTSNNTWTQGPGTYLVRAQDNYGCFVSQNITIAPPNSVVISPVQVTHVTCQGGSSGAINITVSGGSGVYTYQWSNNRTTQDIQNIAAGTYTVTVTDSQGCSAIISAVVNPRLTVTTSTTAVICNGGNTGTATALAVGGAPAYTYLWNNGGTTATITNLVAGTYRVTVTDALGCTRTSVIAVTQPQAINITGTTSIAPCAGQPGGGITISVFNATAPATYLWSDGATTQNRTGIVAGTYTVTVTGANGCTKTKSFTVTSAASMVVTFTATQPTCGGTNGTLKANVTNGTQYPTNNLCNGARYCFQWSNGATTQTATGLAAGTYTVTVTDYAGCSTVAMGTVTQPAVLDITSVGTQQLTNGKYKLTVNATGGVPIYRYKRIPGSAVFQVSNIFNNVAPGTYKIVVQDNSNCTDTLQIVLPVFLSGPGSGDREEMTDEKQVTNLNLFPNPASNMVQLVADREFEQAEVRVYDMQGRFIYHQEFSGNTLTFEVGNWDSGLYILEISSGGERFMRKLSVVKE